MKLHERPFRNLRAVITLTGLSTDAICETLGMSRGTLSSRMMGKAEFTLDEAVKLKALLKSDLPLEELFAK